MLRQAQAVSPVSCPPEQESYNASHLPQTIKPSCGMTKKIIRDHGVVVRVPKAGGGVYTESLLAGGHGSQELGIEVATDGTVTLLHVGNENIASPGEDSHLGSYCENGCPPPCEDDQYSHNSYKETDDHQWYFDRSSAPVNQPQPQLT